MIYFPDFVKEQFKIYLTEVDLKSAKMQTGPLLKCLCRNCRFEIR